MRTLCLLILVSLLAVTAKSQKAEKGNPYDERRKVIGNEQVFKQGLDTYDENATLKVDLIFMQTVVLFAIVGPEESHYLPLPEEIAENDMLEFWWTGNFHNDGYCKIEITLYHERFLVCTQNKCYILEISRPEESVKRKTVYKFRYRDTSLVWDDEEKELVPVERVGNF